MITYKKPYAINKLRRIYCYVFDCDYGDFNSYLEENGPAKTAGKVGKRLQTIGTTKGISLTDIKSWYKSYCNIDNWNLDSEVRALM
jgi:hypothetical protein